MLLSESQHKMSNITVDEERMRPDHWLTLVLCVPFSALSMSMTLMVDIYTIPLIPRGFLLQYVQDEDARGNWVTQVNLQKTTVK